MGIGATFDPPGSSFMGIGRQVDESFFVNGFVVGALAGFVVGFILHALSEAMATRWPRR